jgi:hypothetical protein
MQPACDNPVCNTGVPHAPVDRPGDLEVERAHCVVPGAVGRSLT